MYDFIGFQRRFRLLWKPIKTKNVINILRLFLSILLISSCTDIAENNVANINFTKPVVTTNATFLFSAVGGKMIILADPFAAQKMNDLSMQKGNFSLYDLGIGNAFVVDSEGTFLLYTARHCTKGIESITRIIDNDIAVVNCDGLHAISPSVLEINQGYDVAEKVSDNDSVYVRGYFSDKKGKVHSVLICGIGKIQQSSDYANVQQNKEYIQSRMLSIKMAENIDLAGLSGAPAFNKEGKIIGVYSGRTYDQDSREYSIRISLVR